MSDQYAPPDDDALLYETEEGVSEVLTPEQLALRQRLLTGPEGAQVTPGQLAQEARGQALEQAYGGTLETLRTGLEGAAGAASFGLLDHLGGVEGRYEAGLRAQANPLARGVGVLGGSIAPALLSGGTGAIGSIARMTPGGALAAATGRYASGSVGRSIMAGALEGAIGAAGDQISRLALDENAEFSAEALALGAALGAGAGGIFAGGGKLSDVLAARLSPTSSSAEAGEAVADALGSTAAAGAKAARSRAERVASVLGGDVERTATGGFREGGKAISARKLVSKKLRESTPQFFADLTGAIDNATSRPLAREIDDVLTAPGAAERLGADAAFLERFRANEVLSEYQAASNAARQWMGDYAAALGVSDLGSLTAQQLAKSVPDKLEREAARVLSRLDDARLRADEHIARLRERIGEAPIGAAGAAPARLSDLPVAPAVQDVAPIPAATGSATSAAPEPVRLPSGWEIPADAPDAPVLSGMPGIADVDEGAVYVMAPSALIGRSRGNATRGAIGERVESIKQEWAKTGGKRVTPIEVELRPDGSISMLDGQSRLAAALQDGRDVAVRFRRAEDAEELVRRAEGLDMAKLERDPESGEWINIETGVVVDEGLVRARLDLERVQRTVGDAPDWVKQGLAKRRAGREQVDILDSSGMRPRGVSPRTTDKLVRFRDPRTGLSGLDLGDVRPVTPYDRALSESDARAMAALEGLDEGVPIEQVYAQRLQESGDAAMAALRGLDDVPGVEGLAARVDVEPPATAIAEPDLPPFRTAKEAASIPQAPQAPGIGLETPVMPSAAPGRSRLDAATTLLGGAELASDLGAPLGVSVRNIPVIGEVLSLFLKLKAGAQALRGVGFLPATSTARAASRVNDVREAIGTTVRSAARRVAKPAASAVKRSTVMAIRKEVLDDTTDSARQRGLISAEGAGSAIAQAAGANADRAREYLSSTAPKNPLEGSPWARQWQPAEQEALDWQRRVSATLDPLGAIQRIMTSSASALEAEALRAVYPAIWSEARAHVLEQSEALIAKVPPGRLEAIGRAFDVPLTIAQLPGYGMPLPAISASGTSVAAQQNAVQFRGAPPAVTASPLATLDRTSNEQRR